MDTNIERRDKILHLRAEGKSYSEISKELNCNRSLVAFYCGRRFNIDEQNERETSKKEYESIVCDLAKTCKNVNQICKAVGKKDTNTNRERIKQILKKNDVDISHFQPIESGVKVFIRYKDEDVYCKNSAIKSTKNIRKRLIKDGLKQEVCECCKGTEWLGKPIPLQVHHINGDNTDNRIENLQLLCPNCHAFTDTYCGRAKKIHNITTIKKEDKTPTKNDLIEQFKKLGSFSSVGKVYGVTDNAVRKWCKKRGLPTKKKEMKIFLDKF